jgi:hypothetical protein
VVLGIHFISKRDEESEKFENLKIEFWDEAILSDFVFWVTTGLLYQPWFIGGLQWSTGGTMGDRVSTVVKVLRYKSEGRWFDPRWCQICIDINPSDRTMALGSTQPLTEMSTSRISWG